MSDGVDWELAGFGIFRIAEDVYQGRIPDDNSRDKLSELRVEVIVNASGGTYEDSRFEIHEFNFPDQVPIPLDVLSECLDVGCRARLSKRAIFVHCAAGWNRSANILMLMLMAQGVPKDDAVAMIEAGTLDANPDHPLLVQGEHFEMALNTCAQQTDENGSPLRGPLYR